MIQEKQYDKCCYYKNRQSDMQGKQMIMDTRTEMSTTNKMTKQTIQQK